MANKIIKPKDIGRVFASPPQPAAPAALTQDQMKALFVLRVIETSQCSASDQMQHNLLAAKNWLHQIAQGKAVVVAPVA